MNYPVELTPDDNDTVMARFVDFPGATFGDDGDDALARAVNLLETILASYIDDRRDIPAPSPAEGRPVVGPTLLGTMKVAVYQAMRAAAGASPTSRARSTSIRGRSTACSTCATARRSRRSRRCGRLAVRICG